MQLQQQDLEKVAGHFVSQLASRCCRCAWPPVGHRWCQHTSLHGVQHDPVDSQHLAHASTLAPVWPLGQGPEGGQGCGQAHLQPRDGRPGPAREHRLPQRECLAADGATPSPAASPRELFASSNSYGIVLSRVGVSPTAGFVLHSWLHAGRATNCGCLLGASHSVLCWYMLWQCHPEGLDYPPAS